MTVDNRHKPGRHDRDVELDVLGGVPPDGVGVRICSVVRNLNFLRRTPLNAEMSGNALVKLQSNSVTMRVDDKVEEKSTTVHVAEDAQTFPETKSREDDNI